MKKISKATIFGLSYSLILASSVIFPELYKNTIMIIIGTFGIIVFGALFIYYLLKEDKARKARNNDA